MKKILIVVLLTSFLISCKSNDTEQLVQEHCTADWDSPLTNKEKLIKQVQKHPDLNRDGLPISMQLGTYLKENVKYPATLQVKGRSFNDNVILTYKKAYELDVDAGTWEYRIPFTAENKLGMTVKSLMYVYVKYQAGCKPMEVIDISIL